ncbi:MAG: chorismate synthase [Candidatus Bathyarchaeota archaeon]|nr:MAG: chorismate synthase [Candidatus Bathyarchaeota archaeon]
MLLGSNSIGKEFVVTCFGESHGRCVGAVIDGCPAGLPLSVEDIQNELDKRLPQKAEIVSARREEDVVELFSGTYEGFTTGAPICILVWNKEVVSDSYDMIRHTPRPGHADYPARIKYLGFNDNRGGGRFSGRLTVAYIMAGAIAKKLLALASVEIMAYTSAIGGVTIKKALSVEDVREKTYDSSVRCPDLVASKQMENAILKAKSEGDSVGGIVDCFALNVLPGVGEPLFDSLDADLAKILFGIPAVKGVEFGVGFESSRLKGSENNDPYVMQDGEVKTTTNNSGGILGGMSSGMPIVLRVAIKPTPSIDKEQRTVDLLQMNNTKIQVKGRHDTCIVPKAVPVVESAVALVLIDQMLRAGLIPKVLGVEAVGEYCDPTEEN